MPNMGGTIALSSLLFVFGAALLQAGQSEQPSSSNYAVQGTASSLAGSSDEAGAEDNAAGSPIPAGHMACWKQAGLSKGTVEQRKSIAESAKKQIGAVENDSTLTPAQQKQQIRNIRLNARQEASKLITPEQQRALRDCREARAAAHDATRSNGDRDASGMSNIAPPDSTNPAPSK